MITTAAERQNHHDPARPSDPPRPTVAQAVRRHWVVTALAPLLLVGLAIAIGFQRPETYTAQARLNAGPVGASPQTYSGVAEANQALAGTYSRVVDAQGVIDPVAARLNLSPPTVASRIEASPIPDSSLILIDADGPSERSAVELANQTGDSLIRYVTTLTRRNEDSARLLEEFTRTSRSLQHVVSKRTRLRARTDGQPMLTDQAALGRLEADIEALRLKVRTLSTLYQTSQQGQASSRSIEVLSPAVQAESDRIAVLQGLVFLALVAGAASGVALAVVRSRRGARRRAEGSAPAGDPRSASRTQPNDARRRATSRVAKGLYALIVIAVLGGASTAAYFALGQPDLPGLDSATRTSLQAVP